MSNCGDGRYPHRSFRSTISGSVGNIGATEWPQRREPGQHLFSVRRLFLEASVVELVQEMALGKDEASSGSKTFTFSSGPGPQSYTIIVFTLQFHLCYTDSFQYLIASFVSRLSPLLRRIPPTGFLSSNKFAYHIIIKSLLDLLNCADFLQSLLHPCLPFQIKRKKKRHRHETPSDEDRNENCEPNPLNKVL